MMKLLGCEDINDEVVEFATVLSVLSLSGIGSPLRGRKMQHGMRQDEAALRPADYDSPATKLIQICLLQC